MCGRVAVLADIMYIVMTQLIEMGPNNRKQVSNRHT